MYATENTKVREYQNSSDIRLHKTLFWKDNLNTENGQKMLKNLSISVNSLSQNTILK